MKKQIIREYISACNANIKVGKKNRAKKAFDLAWKEYAAGRFDDNDELHLFWLRENFYPSVDAIFLSENGCRIEGMILAAAGL